MTQFPIDPVSSAFGIFVLAYTRLVQVFACAVWCSERRISTALDYEAVRRRRPSVLLEQFEKEVASFADSESKVHLLRAAKDATKLKDWRNEFVHCRVVRSGGAFALYDFAGNPLRLEVGNIQDKISEALRIEIELQVHIPMLLREADFNGNIDDFLKDRLGED